MSAKADNRASKALHFQCRLLTQEVYCVSNRTVSSGITREGGLMTISIAVLWPDGKSETFPSVAADQVVTLRRGAGK